MTSFTGGRLSTIANWFGIAASSACAIHCVLVPVLLVSGTVLPASILGDEAFHLAMISVIFPAALVAFGIGCWRHKDTWVLILGLTGLGGIILAYLVVHDIAGELSERITTLVSALILICAHYRNYLLCRSSRCNH